MQLDKLAERNRHSRSLPNECHDSLEPELKQTSLMMPASTSAKRKARQGPCIFGCLQSSGKSRGKEQWFSVPAPSPWPGVDPGATLCRKCHNWARTAKRARVLRGAAVLFSVGQRVKIIGLKRCTELNGAEAFVNTVAGQDGRITVELANSGRQVRICKDALRAVTADAPP